MKIHCNVCGEAVSDEIQETIKIKAWIECPECIKMDDKAKARLTVARFRANHRRWQMEAEKYENSKRSD